MESILNSCKTMLGIDPEVKVFDEELIIHINSVFNVLHQLGVGPQDKLFIIKDDGPVWSEFIEAGEFETTEMVRTFMYLKLRLVFDPPSNSFTITSFETQMKELEWRLCCEADPTKLIYGNDDGGSGGSPTPSPSGGADAVLKDDLTASIGAGGIQIGDKFIANTELEALWRALLDPIKNPTLVDPSVSITPSGGLLMETGSSKEVTLIVNFNRGAITPDYGTSGLRSGEATGYTLNGVSQSSNHFTVIVDETQGTFSATVNYAEGEQPKNSKSEDYDSPLPAGSVTSQTISYEFVDALWSNQQDITQVTKEALVSKSAKQKTFDFPAQTRQYPEIFDVPKSWGNITIEGFNDLTQRFESIPSDFDRSDVLHQNGGGVDVEYNRYTDNRGVNAGPRRIRISWN